MVTAVSLVNVMTIMRCFGKPSRVIQRRSTMQCAIRDMVSRVGRLFFTTFQASTIVASTHGYAQMVLFLYVPGVSTAMGGGTTSSKDEGLGAATLSAMGGGFLVVGAAVGAVIKKRRSRTGERQSLTTRQSGASQWAVHQRGGTWETTNPMYKGQASTN